MRVLETERLLLRHLCREDLEDLAALGANPEFTRFFGGPQPIEVARERVAVYLERVSAEYASTGTGFYATIYRPEGRFIGRCGLLWQEIDGARELEIAYGIAPAYWGRGLATEAARALKEYAFRRYDVPRLISLVHPENIASRRVAWKNGMRCARQVEFDGGPCDVYVVERADAGE